MNRLAVLGKAVVVATALALAGTGHAAGLIDPALEEVLRTAAPDETVSTIVFLADQVDVKGLTDDLDQAKVRLRRRHEVVVRSLRQTAEVTNRDMLAHLATLSTTNRVSSFEPFWIVNAIRVDAVPAEIVALADRPGVQRIYFNHELELVTPVGEPVEGGGTLLGAPEPGVEAVRAPEVWALGYTGAGVLVANIDTGVDGAHPALASRWAGVADLNYAGHPEWAWYDPHFGDNSFPYDENGHGTHTMGSVCGGSPGDQVGVAPGAYWIAAGAIDRPGASIPDTVAHAISAFQWMIDPDGNPATSWDVPAVCSNSWGVTTSHGYPECDELFWSFLDAMEAAGTVVLFSAGNEGSTGLRRPSDRATDDYRTLAVAAVDANDSGWPIANFSSRGPTNCTPDGSPAIKPDIAAPGVNVRSSVPGGGYSSFSGTSMASPHVNGVVALMREANPDLTVEQIKQILYDTAFDLGDPGEDNAYGHGMVDAFEAVQLALSTVGLTFEFPSGRPDLIDPDGGTTIRVNVNGQSVAPEPGTGLLHYRADGGAFTAVAMDEVSPNVYDAIFPSFGCGAKVDYYFSAETEEGDLAFNPFSAPQTFYSAEAYTGIVVTYDDDFETDNGWTVANVELEDGQWDRGVPIGGGDRGDPAADADGSGQCWLTDNEDDNSDVDGGPTILTSSQLDASGLPDATLQYARWFTNDDQDIDRLTVEISDDNGASWTLIESVAGGGGWQTVSHRIADYVTPNDQIRVRFSATDNPNDSVTEAGVDAVKITSFFCEETGCLGDIDGNDDIGFNDLLDILANWGPCVGCPQDLDGDDQVGFTDVLYVLSNWGPCP